MMIVPKVCLNVVKTSKELQQNVQVILILFLSGDTLHRMRKLPGDGYAAL